MKKINCSSEWLEGWICKPSNWWHWSPLTCHLGNIGQNFHLRPTYPPPMYERTLKNDCIPTTHTYLLSLGHVSVALGTDRAGWFRRLEGSTVHLQPSQITAPEAALIHDACLRCPPNAGAVACGLVCTKQSGPGVRQSCLHPQSPHWIPDASLLTTSSLYYSNTSPFSWTISSNIWSIMLH